MKKLYFLFTIVLIICFAESNAQGIWTPTTAPLAWDRYDDIYFSNADTGWAICIYSDYGYLQHSLVLRTYTGGESWDSMNAPSTCFFRDVAFLNNQVGFIGTLSNNGLSGVDTVIMFKSTDAGLSWGAVTNLPGPRPEGICGMKTINDSTLYACGRFYGPAGFFKTTDTGKTWSYKDMDSLAGGLVDAFFFDADTGFVCGGTLTGFSTNGYGRILYTTDGGDSWQQVMQTTHDSELCWKMSFPSRYVGYASIESFRSLPNDSQFCLKTIDGGLSWTEIHTCNSAGDPYGFDAQGIGFLNDTVGWIGGRNNGPPYSFKTTDGGQNWELDSIGESLNRFRFINPNLAYFSGETVYKYTCSPIPIPTISDSGGILSTQSFNHYQWYLNGNLIPGANSSAYSATVNGYYSVQVANSNGCIGNSVAWPIGVSDLNNYTNSLLKIYPNPAANSIYAEGLTIKSPVSITNSEGKEVMNFIAKTINIQIDISALPAGIYFLNGKKFSKQ